MAPWRHIARLDSLLDCSVQTTGGETIGRVHDVLIDLSAGRLHAVVVRLRRTHKGAGANARAQTAGLYVVPWSRLHPVFNLPTLIVDGGLDSFRGAETLADNQDMSDLKSIHRCQRPPRRHWSRHTP